jgi:hypothetical protein
MAQSWHTFSWLASQGLEFPFVAPFVWVTAALVADLLAALFISKSRVRQEWQSSYWMLFLQLLCIPIMCAIGTVYWTSPIPFPRATPNKIGVRLVDASLCLFLFIGVYYAWRMKHLRWLSISISLLLEWIAMGFAFVAAMAVTGQWL